MNDTSEATPLHEVVIVGSGPAAAAGAALSPDASSATATMNTAALTATSTLGPAVRHRINTIAAAEAATTMMGILASHGFMVGAFLVQSLTRRSALGWG